jgi:hypothetical protein
LIHHVNHVARSTRRILTHRTGLIICGMTIIVLSGYIVYLFTETKNGFEFLEHVAAGVVAVLGVTFIIERPLKRHYKDIKTLTPTHFFKEMGCAKARIQIMDIWMKSFLLEKDYKGFRRAVMAAVKDGIHVQILVAKPDSIVAAARARALADNANDFAGKTPADVAQMMRECADILAALYREAYDWYRIKRKNHGLFPLEIRFFSSPITLSMYKVDNITYWNHFRFDMITLKGEQYVTINDKGPAAFMVQHFDSLWNDPDTIEIDDYIASR